MSQRAKKSRSDVEPPPPGICDPEVIGLFEDILNSGSSLRVKVTGGSMAPFLQGGDIVTLKEASCSSLHRGDLIFFKDSRGAPALHRLIRKRRASSGGIIFQTKGDATILFDEPVPYQDVLGKVCKIEKGSPSGKLTCINMESKGRRIMGYLTAWVSFMKWTGIRYLRQCRCL
ncbi:MAG: signal peptidase I [Deltaproteobacteria bacterium]|nr:signal peptidase I [Deltaproteobacteria bacterium]